MQSGGRSAAPPDGHARHRSPGHRRVRGASKEEEGLDAHRRGLRRLVRRRGVQVRLLPDARTTRCVGDRLHGGRTKDRGKDDARHARQRPVETYRRDLCWISEAAWQCGDPNLQYDDKSRMAHISRTARIWHTSTVTRCPPAHERLGLQPRVAELRSSCRRTPGRKQRAAGGRVRRRVVQAPSSSSRSSRGDHSSGNAKYPGGAHPRQLCTSSGRWPRLPEPGRAARSSARPALRQRRGAPCPGRHPAIC